MPVEDAILGGESLSQYNLPFEIVIEEEGAFFFFLPYPIPYICKRGFGICLNCGLLLLLLFYFLITGGNILHAKDYKIRSSILDKDEHLHVFFVKIKKNSHYGRTRFVIKIRNKKRQQRDMYYLETNLLNDKETSLQPAHETSSAEQVLLVSLPIVVISKERKSKRKRAKLDA